MTINNRKKQVFGCRCLHRIGARILQSLIPILAFASTAHGQIFPLDDLPNLTRSRTKAENALWTETPLTVQFKSTNRVTVADLKGPGVITMIHFAMPSKLQLNRDVLLRIFWDGETSPSVNLPLVDFFCDPAGLREEVNTALVNKRRGFNAYFPMPFRRAARIELLYDGTVAPGDALWRIMPCYSYVIYRTPEKVSKDAAYFHANWRQETLLLGKTNYVAIEAKGRGKFIGWNVTVRSSEGTNRYPVDENAKFFVDGENAPSVELMGLEDAFGFSYGFPPTESQFPFTGCFPFLNGEAAYRFFVHDAIGFQKSLRLTIGFGAHEDAHFRKTYSRPDRPLHFSTTTYWYQLEPHAPLPDVPSAAERVPVPDKPPSLEKEKLPTTQELQSRGIKLELRCGRPGKELIFAENGYSARTTKGFAWDGWDLPVYYCRADKEKAAIELTVPLRTSGIVRIFVIDPDDYDGGRKQRITVGGDSLGLIENFGKGRWLEHRLTQDQTASGKVLIQAINAREGGNAVISIIEWVEGT